jgi:hypothetical protein
VVSESVQEWEPGANTITATYLGDDDYAASVGQMIQQVKFPPLIVVHACTYDAGTLSGCTGDSLVGMRVVAQLLINGYPVATGSVQFVVDGGTFGPPAPLSTTPEGNAVTAVSDQPLALPPGPHTLEARYAGDANYSPGSSTLDATLYQYPSTVALSSSVNPIYPWTDPTTFTITVHGPDGAPPAGGTVQLSIGPFPLGPVLPVVNGVATLANQGEEQLGIGVLGVKATYSGDGYVFTGGSAFITQYVIELDARAEPPGPEAAGPGSASPASIFRGALARTGITPLVLRVALLLLLVGVALTRLPRRRRA